MTTPDLGRCISGAILHDETIHQETKVGIPFVNVLVDAGIIPGIKVDAGAKDLAGHVGEKITEGNRAARRGEYSAAMESARARPWSPPT